MTLKFTPKTEEELNPLLQEGIYNFTVSTCEEKTSRSGNAMLKLTLQVFDTNGRSSIVYDYLTDHEAMAYKIKHFCEAVGLNEKYKAGYLEDIYCINKSGKLKIVIKKDTTGKYKDQNSVTDYVKKELHEETTNDPSMEDDLNF